MKPFTLHDRQLEALTMLASPARHAMLYGGSRSGKTVLLVRSVVMRALKAPGSRHAIFRHKGVHLVPSIILGTFPFVMRNCYPGVQWEMQKKDGYARLEGDSEVWFCGLDDKERTEKVLGNEYATLYFNESSQIPYASVLTALTRLAQTTTLRQRAWFDCNPPGTTHWTYRLFVEGRDPQSRQSLPDPDDYVAMVMNPKDNAANLDPKYLKALQNMPERQRRRFWDGSFTDEVDGALWTIAGLDGARVDRAPHYDRIVVAVDPSGASGDEDERSDEIGIVVGGKAGPAFHVLEDLSERIGPEAWADKAAEAYKRWRADCIVAERNFGGDMVRAVIQARHPNIPVKLVTASRGKAVRAEPVSVLYQQGNAGHVGRFPELEEQLCSFTVSGYKGDRSPDRADALVWAATELMFGEEADEGEIFRREDIRLWPNTKVFPAFEFIILSYHAPYAEHCADHNATMTAWGVFAAPGGKRAVLLLDCWSKPLDYNEFRALVVKEWKEKYGPKDTARRPDFAVMRSRDAGTGLLRDLRMAGANRVPVREVPTVGADDVANANAVAPLVSSGLLYVPEASAEFVAKNPAARGQPRTWARPLVDQMATFSADALAISKAQRKDGLDRHHFEYVRAAVQALAVLRDSRWLLADAEEKEIPKRPRKGNPYMA